MEQTGIRKLWDILYPFVCILLCMMMSTMIGFMGFGLLTGLQGLNNEMVLVLFPWLSLVISLIASVLTMVILRKTLMLDQLKFGFNKKDWKPWQYAAAALTGTAAGHVWSSLIYVSGIAKIFTGYSDGASRAFSGQPIWLVVLSTVLAVPVAEELVFRWMIYRRAKHWYGRAAGLVISALLFGLYHANVVQFIYAAGFSILLTYLYEKSGNILAPVLAHAGANLWAVILDQFLPEYSTAPTLRFLAAEVLLAAIGTLGTVLPFRFASKEQ
ncbi:MAG: type II CAAX endopeptidase family protein [Lachnospiraceae bacterium]|nr:type II CAAX endopeptidase family protein [Lachnospiraceae bacterium]